jgi:hypothetical protein
MTKKDYIAIARAIHNETKIPQRCPLIRAVPCAWHGVICATHYTEAQRITARIADALAQDSPRFDRARFIEACETGNMGKPKPRPRCKSCYTQMEHGTGAVYCSHACANRPEAR